MNLNNIRPKNETEDLLVSVTKIVEHFLKRLTQNHKKHLNLPNQRKYSLLNHQSQLKNAGWLD